MVFGNAAYAGCQWLLIVAVSNIGTPLDVGRYALGLAIVGPIFILMNMGLRQVITTDVRGEWGFRNYFKLRIQSLAFGFLMVLFYILFIGEINDTTRIILLLAISKIVDGILDVYYGFYQRHHRFDLVSASRAITGILGAAFFVGIYYYTKEIEYALIALIIGWALSSIIIGNNKVRDIQSSNAGYVTDIKVGTAKDFFDKKLFLLALPLGWSALLISLRTNIPRYFIEIDIGTIELGVFAITGYLIHLLGIVVAALGRTACPRLAEYAADKEYNKFLKLLYALLLSAFVLGISGLIASIFWGGEILSFFYGQEFYKYNIYLTYMMIIGLISYVSGFLNYALESLRIFKKHFIISLISTLVCLISCYILVDDYGILGACIGWFLGLLTQVLYSSFFIYQKCHEY